MKKKNLVCVSALCALMSFSFVSCDDDNEPSLNIPNVSVTNVSFTDENPEALKVSGTLNWTAPSSVDNVTKYVIYGSSDGTAKDMKIAEVEVGTHSYAITDVVNIGYLLVIAANAEGESSVYASVRVIDFVKDSSFMALYFLNSGNMGNNNSSLYMYDIEKGEGGPDYFLAQNGRGLGDTAQDMIVYGDKMYIAVYGESTIEVTDLKAKSIKQVKTEGQPRYMVSEGGKVYISYYNGYVARLDTASLEVEAKVKVGRNPEQLAVSSNKLFVSNSGGMDYSTEVGDDKTVSVVDLSTFTEIKKLDVVLNPTRIQADEQGNVYVVSMGNYADIPNTVQKINTETYEVTSLTNCPNATEMAYEDGKLFLFYAQWGMSSPAFLTFDTKSQSAGTSFITDGTSIQSPYSISAVGGNVYVAESDYKNNGDIYCFGGDGKLFKKFEAGLNPMKVVLAQKDNI